MMSNNETLPKGFSAGSCYIGFLPGNKKMSFPTEKEYIEFVEEMTMDDAAV